MKSNYKRLGNYIRIVDVRNKAEKRENLLGLSVAKVFIKSIANTVGTDFSTYRVVKRNQFTYIPDTSRRGDKIAVALQSEFEEGLVSQAYTVFEVTDHNALLPEYLMMWFRRPEFDRYARFMSHGSVRELFEWEDMCNVALPIPPVNKQREIVNEYNVIQSRIALNQRIIQRLNETAQCLYKQWFVDFEFPNEQGKPYKSTGGEMFFHPQLEMQIPKGWDVRPLSDFCDVKGGKRLPKDEELNDLGDGNPYIRVADMNRSKYTVLNGKFQYVENAVQKLISRYVVSEDDVIISIVGTIGLVSVIHKSLDGANLTENCMKLTNFNGINSDFLYHFLVSAEGQRIIETKTVGGVQGKLPLYNIQSIPILYSNNKILLAFSKLLFAINDDLVNRITQNAKLSEVRDLLLSKLASIES